MLTILADENISHLDEYFCHHPDIRLIKLKGRDITQDALDKHTPDALFIRSVTPINANTITNPHKLSFIGTATIGTDHVDTAFLKSHFIRFANAKGCSKHSVAQYVITAILSIRPHLAAGQPTLGIIGLGNIGSTLAAYAADLGWQIQGYDPYLPKSTINNSSLAEVLQSDIISIHTPLTHEGDHPTFGMINQGTLGIVKPNALLINSARGEIVIENALMNAIKTKNITAVLDVFPHEPTISDELLHAVALATPHIAGYTLEGKLRGTDMIYQAFCQAFGITAVQSLKELLPANTYHWQNLLNKIGAGQSDCLAEFYDIEADFRQLKSISTENGVKGVDFDNLRKNYPLRREWMFDLPKSIHE